MVNKTCDWLREKGYKVIYASNLKDEIQIDVSPENLIPEVRALILLMKECGIEFQPERRAMLPKIIADYIPPLDDDTECATIIICGLTDELMRKHGVIP